MSWKPLEIYARFQHLWVTDWSYQSILPVFLVDLACFFKCYSLSNSIKQFSRTTESKTRLFVTIMEEALSNNKELSTRVEERNKAHGMEATTPK